jgi:hypothetical protein
MTCQSVALIATLVLVPAGLGCNSVSSTRVDAIVDADALWGGGGFCARTPKGLACWNTDEGQVVRTGPTVVEGLEGVQGVALRIGEGCALHAKGVSCFRPGESGSRPIAFDRPTQIVATGGYPGLVCVLDATGVSCWGGEVRTPTPQAALGKPNALFVSTNGGALCGLHEDGPRCFEINFQGQIGKGIRLAGVKDLKGLMVSSTGGHAYVMDGAHASYGHFDGTLRVGNPFAVSNPLDVDVTVQPFHGATVTPKPIPGVGAVRAMASWSIWPVVLDDQGIASIDAHAGKFDIERWPSNGIVSHLWNGYHDVFYAREGDTLHERGREDGKFFDRVVKGVSKPVHVAADTYTTCVLEEGGGVACLRSPRE